MEEKVIAILKEILENENVTALSTQDNTENWDSLHQLMLVGELEATFNVSLEPEDIAEIKSVNDIIKIIEKKK